jgi:hypothetical protein
MMVIVEQLVECELAGDTEALGESLPQRHFIGRKSHMIRPGLETGPPRWKLAINRLSHGATYNGVSFKVYM